jgi:hypothetical protein
MERIKCTETRNEPVEYTRWLPSGEHKYLWITAKRQQIVYIVDGYNQQYIPVKMTTHPSLSFGCGTILQVIIYMYKGIKCACIVDIHYYKGQHVGLYQWNRKFDMLSNLLNNEYVPYPTKSLFLGLPYTLQGFHTHINRELSYKSVIQYLGETYITVAPKQRYVLLSATEKEDIYVDENEQKVLVSSYKASKAMNRLYRNVRENEDLDLLEVSDDEYDNPDTSKWIRPVKHRVLCKWNNKYKIYEVVEPIIYV